MDKTTSKETTSTKNIWLVDNDPFGGVTGVAMIALGMTFLKSDSILAISLMYTGGDACYIKQISFNFSDGSTIKKDEPIYDLSTATSGSKKFTKFLITKEDVNKFSSTKVDKINFETYSCKMGFIEKQNGTSMNSLTEKELRKKNYVRLQEYASCFSQLP